MEVAILGPLRLTVDGAERAVPPGRQPALLAALALRADQVVSADRLVDIVWGDDALPANPANALQGRISQLRKIVGRDAISQETAGYRLRLDPMGVDAHRFEQLARQGHDRLAAGDAHAAVTLLDQALDLWRGTALAEFVEEPWARGEAARLEERRLAAVEDRFEAALALGRHTTALPELEATLAQHPLRERLRKLVMLALYRLGRQSDALETYEEGRRILGDELGLDPGPELQQLQRDILTQAEHLIPDEVEQPARRLSNLPGRLTSFIGRDEHVTQLRTLLDGSRLVTLIGPGGAGKSRLAVETADGLTPPDGVWLVELAEVADPGDVVPAIADALELTGSAGLLAEARDQAEQLVAALQPRRLVLMLDNCEHVIDAAARVVTQLLTRCDGLTVLATSREPLGVGGEAVWSVPSLPAPADDTVEAVRASPAAQLLVDRLVRHQTRFELDDETAPAVAAICRRLDGIPLALELAAARGRVLGVDDIAGGLDDRFELLVGGGRAVLPRHQTLEAVIDWSWELLDEQQRTALAALSVFAGRFDLTDAQRLLDAAVDIGPASSRWLVADLAERSLLEPDGQRSVRFRMLETIRAYASNKRSERDLAEDPRAAHAAMMIDKADALYPRDSARWDLDLRQVDELLGDVRAALHHAANRGDDATVQRLAGALGWYWWLRGRRDEGIRWLAPALSSEVHDDRAALWAGVLLLGKPHPQVMGWLECASGSSDPTVGLVAEGCAALHLATRQDLDAGLERLAGLLDKARLIGGWPEACARLFLGLTDLARGDLAQGGAHVTRADEQFEQAGATWGQLLASDALASLAEIRGDYREAVERRTRALAAARRLAMSENEVVQTIHLGNLATLDDDHQRARDYHEQALHLAERTGQASLTAFACNGSGLGARRKGDLDEAEGYHRRAASIYDDLEEWGGAAFAHSSLGFTLEQRGDHHAALDAHRVGLERATQAGDPRAVALALEGVSGALVAVDPDRAARLLGAAEQIRDDLGAPLPARERFDVDRIQGALAEALGDRRAAVVDQGRSLSLEQATRLAAVTAS